MPNTKPTTFLPSTLPIFPLAGVLLLPGGQLPLNIFEPRYLSMVDDALACPSRLIGIIQPKSGIPDTYPIGCAGRITSFSETDDGRYLITLSGVSRFTIMAEHPSPTGSYRRIIPDWGPHQYDTEPKATSIPIDRTRLNSLLQSYFHQQGLSCDWSKIEITGDIELLTALAMICPLSAAEKQAILEAPNIESRTDLFLNLIEMAITSPHTDSTEQQGCEIFPQCH